MCLTMTNTMTMTMTTSENRGIMIHHHHYCHQTWSEAVFEISSSNRLQENDKKITSKVGEEAGEHLGGMVEEGGTQLAGTFLLSLSPWVGLLRSWSLSTCHMINYTTDKTLQVIPSFNLIILFQPLSLFSPKLFIGPRCPWSDLWIRLSLSE